MDQVLDRRCVSENAVKADKAQNAKVRSKTLARNIKRRRANFAHIKLDISPNLSLIHISEPTRPY